jgi:alkylated DNA nucleotide flippase Atl1
VRVDREAYVEEVLRIVEAIPPGRVTTYGAIADSVGVGGPRQVGQVMANYGGPVPWWRVVRSDGSLPDTHQRSARHHYLDEGTPLRGGLRAVLRVDLATALWTPAAGRTEDVGGV